MLIISSFQPRCQPLPAVDGVPAREDARDERASGDAETAGGQSNEVCN